MECQCGLYPNLNLGGQCVVFFPTDSTQMTWEGVLGRSEKWWGDGCCRTSGYLRLLKPKLEVTTPSSPLWLQPNSYHHKSKMTQLCFVFLISPSSSIFWGLTFFWSDAVNWIQSMCFLTKICCHFVASMNRGGGMAVMGYTGVLYKDWL